jgi:SAM-dependent methyltransferase
MSHDGAAPVTHDSNDHAAAGGGGSHAAEQRSQRLARYYDLDFLDIGYDAELYQRLAHETGGPVLELGVGSGRLAIPLALAGYDVVGIDNDRAMLQRAQATWDDARGELEPGRLRLHEGDYRELQPERRFGLALMAVNTFLLAEDDAARRALLATMAASLRPGGIAVVEVGTPDDAELERYDRRMQHEWLRQDPVTGEQVSKTIVADHDPDAGTLRLTQLFEWTPPEGGPVSRVSRVDLLHLISAEELRRSAREAGFGSVDVWGDHLLTPYDAGSQRAILVARLV